MGLHVRRIDMRGVQPLCLLRIVKGTQILALPMRALSYLQDELPQAGSAPDEVGNTELVFVSPAF